MRDTGEPYPDGSRRLYIIVPDKNILAVVADLSESDERVTYLSDYALTAMNYFGSQGWELVSMEWINGCLTAFFKRQTRE
ncbi:MAG: hypothetical protein ACE5KG_06260 [Nitrososphaerales archaeon]